ncbi:MAG: hypothetical protein BRC41_00220 [Cyanobacteria bacterium QH_9_48_43]|nr:MAG: hypothetical protein BRC41_00220 [Cyanobacteria bacterium QH_9_48_43]
MQCDELWSFVDDRGKQQWVCLALDAETPEVVGVYVGAREEAAARKLWESLPQSIAKARYALRASCLRHITYTDFWAAYATVLPSQRHQVVDQDTGKTSYMERFNYTQRVSRLVRKTLSFSTSLENHIGAIWYFVHFYHASLLV